MNRDEFRKNLMVAALAAGVSGVGVGAAVGLHMEAQQGSDGPSVTRVTNYPDSDPLSAKSYGSLSQTLDQIGVKMHVRLPAPHQQVEDILGRLSNGVDPTIVVSSQPLPKHENVQYAMWGDKHIAYSALGESPEARGMTIVNSALRDEIGGASPGDHYRDVVFDADVQDTYRLDPESAADLAKSIAPKAPVAEFSQHVSHERGRAEALSIAQGALIEKGFSQEQISEMPLKDSTSISNALVVAKTDEFAVVHAGRGKLVVLDSQQTAPDGQLAVGQTVSVGGLENGKHPVVVKSQAHDRAIGVGQ